MTEYNVLTLSGRDTELLTIWTTQRRRCLRCENAYLEVENIGAWLCAQHVGVYTTGRWTCCGRTSAPGPRERGCVRAHHKWNHGPYSSREPPLAVSESLARQLVAHFHEDSLESGNTDAADHGELRADNYFIVRRYDQRAEHIVFETREPLEDTFAQPDPFAGLDRKLYEIW